MRGKLIQLVHFVEGIELLKYRLENFKEVDKFIVFGINVRDLRLEHDNDVVFLETSESIVDELTKYLIDTCESFEDIIIYSEENEFCNFSNFEKIKNDLVFDHIFLRHHDFWWGNNYISNLHPTGSLIFTFSHLLQDKKLLQRKLKERNNYSYFYRENVINGWKFNKFFSYDEDDLIYKKNLLPKNNKKIRLSIFKNQTEIPPNFETLPSLSEPEKQKFLIVFDNTESEEFKNYDKIVKISFEHDIFDSVSVTEDNIHFECILSLPNQILYGNKNYEEFIEEYKTKEVNKIINSLRITDKDIFVIKNPS